MFIGDLERLFAESLYPNRVLIGLIAIAALAMLAVVAWRRRWDRVVRRHPLASAAAFAVVLVIVAPIGWYLGSPLFLSTTFDEPPPVAAAASIEPTPLASTSAPPGSPAASATAPLTPTTSSSPKPASLVERSGRFRGADDFHFGKGTARLIETSPGSFAVRLEDFAVRNGPDLFVYLSPSQDGYVDGAIELGRLKADRGNQNYQVPPGSDVTDATSVVIWCKQFAVLFAAANLDEAPA
ncbi:MAG: DM13 domain-containing protein [Chloroflexota bacterium]